MFGYVTVDPKVLTPEQRARFQGCYCGLCRCLRREYGLKGQLTLSFDMTDVYKRQEHDDQKDDDRVVQKRFLRRSVFIFHHKKAPFLKADAPLPATRMPGYDNYTERKKNVNG